MFKSLNGGLLPQRATKYSAGFDVFANEDMVIGAGVTKVIGLGVCLDYEIHNDKFTKQRLFKSGNIYEPIDRYYLELHPRSSLRSKGLGGGIGIIDMDYRDEIKMVITNPFTNATRWVTIKDGYGNGIGQKQVSDNKSYEIKRGDKIGQLILKCHEGWLLPAEYTKDEERTGGFGSTDE